MVPLKGSAAGATFHITNRPHAVIIKLPKAAALITMKLYRPRRLQAGVIYQNETDAKPEDGTVIKVIVTDPGPPEVEIKDDFVRVTIRARPPRPRGGGGEAGRPGSRPTRNARRRAVTERPGVRSRSARAARRRPQPPWS